VLLITIPGVRRFGVIACIGAAGLLALGTLVATAADSGSQSQPSLRERLDLGVVAIDATIARDRVRSSGTVINADDGLVLTSAHAVWGATSIRLATALGVLHGRIVARAPCDDLAVIDTQPRIPGLVALPAAPAAGGLLSAVGRRRVDADAGVDGLLTIPVAQAASGVVVKTDPRLSPLKDAVRLDSTLVAETTGGPIVDAEGRVVAIAQIVDSQAAARNVAIPWAKVRRRLDELRPGPRRLFVGWRYQYRCAPGLNTYARARHPGFQPGDARLNAPVPASRLPGTGDLDG
jgi:S1-C subfamily serine protease